MFCLLLSCTSLTDEMFSNKRTQEEEEEDDERHLSHKPLSHSFSHSQRYSRNVTHTNAKQNHL